MDFQQGDLKGDFQVQDEAIIQELQQQYQQLQEAYEQVQAQLQTELQLSAEKNEETQRLRQELSRSQNEYFGKERSQAQKLQETETSLRNEQSKNSKLQEKNEQLLSEQVHYKNETQSYKQLQQKMESQFKTQERELLTLRLQNDRLMISSNQIIEEKKYYENEEEKLREQIRVQNSEQQDKIFQQTLMTSKLQNELKNTKEKNEKLEQIQIQQKHSLQRSEKALRDAEKKLLHEKEINFKTQYEFELKVKQAQSNAEDLEMEISNCQLQIQEKERVNSDLNNHMIQATRKYRESFEKWEEAQTSLEKENEILKEQIEQLQFKVDNSNLGTGFENLKNIENMLQSNDLGSAEQQGLVEELLRERQSNKLLKNQVQYVAGEIQRKASIFQQQQDEYRKILEINEKLQGSLSGASQDKKSLTMQVQQLESSNQRLSRDLKIYKQRHEDLFNQVKVLLDETMQDQNIMSLPYGQSTPGARQSMGHRQSLSRARSRSTRPPDVIDVNQVITEQLVTFKNVDQLIAQNQKLLAVVRCMSEDKDVDIEDMRRHYERQIQGEREEVERSMLDVQKELANNALSIQQLTKQKDLYKGLLNEMKLTLEKERQISVPKSMLKNNSLIGNGHTSAAKLQSTPVQQTSQKLAGGFAGTYSIARKINFGQSMQPIESPLIDPDYWRQQYETQKDQMEKQASEFQKEKEKLLSQEQNLYQKLNEIKIERDKLNFQKELNESRFKGLESEKQYVLQDYTSEQIRSKSLQQQLDSITTRYEEQIHKTEEYQVQCANLQGQSTQLQMQIKSLEESKSQVNKNLESVQNEKIQIEVELRSLQQSQEMRGDMNQKEIQRFREDLAQSQNNYITEHNRFESYKKEQDDQIKLLKIEKTETVKSMEKTYEQYKEVEIRLTEVSIKLQEQESKVRYQEDQIQGYKDLQNDLSDSQVNAMENKENIDSLEQEKEVLSKNQTELNSQIDMLKESLASQETRNEGLQQEKERALKELDDLQSTYRQTQLNFQSEISKLKVKIQVHKSKSQGVVTFLKQICSSIKTVHQNNMEVKEQQVALKSQFGASLVEAIENVEIVNKELRNMNENNKQWKIRYEQLENLSTDQIERIGRLEETGKSNDKEIQKLQNLLTATESDLQTELESEKAKVMELEASLQKMESEKYQSGAILDNLQKIIEQSRIFNKEATNNDSTDNETAQSKEWGFREEEIGKWEEAINYVRQDRDALFGQVAKLQQEVQSWRSNSKNLEEEVKRLKLSVGKEDKTPTRQYMDSAEYQQMQGKLESLNSFREFNSTLRREKQELNHQMEDLHAQIIKKDQSIIQMEQNMGSLKGQVAAKEKELMLSQVQAKKWKNRVDQIIENMGNAGGVEFQKLQEETSEAQEALRKERDQTKINKLRIEDLEKEVASYLSKTKEMEASENEIKVNQDKLKKQLADSRSSYKQLETEKAIEKQKSDKIQGMLKKQSDSLKSANEKLKSVERQYNDLKGDYKNLQESVKKLKEEMQDAKNKNNEQIEKIKGFEVEKKQLQNKIETLQTDLTRSEKSSELQSELQQARKDLESQKQICNNKIQEVSQLKDDNTKLQKNINQVQELYNKLQQEHLQSEQSHVKALDGLEQKFKKSEQELTKTKNELTFSMAAFNKVKAQMGAQQQQQVKAQGVQKDIGQQNQRQVQAQEQRIQVQQEQTTVQKETPKNVAAETKVPSIQKQEIKAQQTKQEPGPSQTKVAEKRPRQDQATEQQQKVQQQVSDQEQINKKQKQTLETNVQQQKDTKIDLEQNPPLVSTQQTKVEIQAQIKQLQDQLQERQPQELQQLKERQVQKTFTDQDPKVQAPTADVEKADLKSNIDGMAKTTEKLQEQQRLNDKTVDGTQAEVQQMDKVETETVSAQPKDVGVAAQQQETQNIEQQIDTEQVQSGNLANIQQEIPKAQIKDQQPQVDTLQSQGSVDQQAVQKRKRASQTEENTELAETGAQQTSEEQQPEPLPSKKQKLDEAQADTISEADKMDTQTLQQEPSLGQQQQATISELKQEQDTEMSSGQILNQENQGLNQPDQIQQSMDQLQNISDKIFNQTDQMQNQSDIDPEAIDAEYQNIQAKNRETLQQLENNADLQEYQQKTDNTQQDLEQSQVQQDEEMKDEVQQGDVQQGDVQSGDVQQRDVQQGDVKQGDIQKVDVQQGDVQQRDVQQGELGLDDVQQESLQKEQVPLGDEQQNKEQLADTKQTSSQQMDVQQSDLQQGGMQQDNVQEVDVQQDDVQQSIQDASNNQQQEHPPAQNEQDMDQLQDQPIQSQKSLDTPLLDQNIESKEDVQQTVRDQPAVQESGRKTSVGAFAGSLLGKAPSTFSQPDKRLSPLSSPVATKDAPTITQGSPILPKGSPAVTNTSPVISKQGNESVSRGMAGTPIGEEQEPQDQDTGHSGQLQEPIGVEDTEAKDDGINIDKLEKTDEEGVIDFTKSLQKEYQQGSDLNLEGSDLNLQGSDYKLQESEMNVQEADFNAQKDTQVSQLEGLNNIDTGINETQNTKEQPNQGESMRNEEEQQDKQPEQESEKFLNQEADTQKEQKLKDIEDKNETEQGQEDLNNQQSHIDVQENSQEQTDEDKQ